MATTKRNNRKSNHLLPKSPTGIAGLDEITGGGLPKGRPTLVAGAAGSGKTLFAMEFLVRGATQYDEPGVFMAFEENAEELAQNVASLGFDLHDLARKNKLIVDYIRVERTRSRRPGNTTWKGCSSAWDMPLIPSVRSGSPWIRSKFFLGPFPTRAF